MQTVLQVSFAEVRTGDTLIVLRDNTGWGADGGPQRELVTVHPRSIQEDASAYATLYGTQAKVWLCMLRFLSVRYSSGI